MKGKSVSRAKRGKDDNATMIGIGHIFGEILDEKGISIPQFTLMLSESKYAFVISEHMLYKILEDKVNFRSDYVGMFIDVAHIDADDLTRRLVSYSIAMRDSGDLYHKKPYYPRKKTEEGPN